MLGGQRDPARRGEQEESLGLVRGFHRVAMLLVVVSFALALLQGIRPVLTQMSVFAATSLLFAWGGFGPTRDLRALLYLFLATAWVAACAAIAGTGPAPGTAVTLMLLVVFSGLFLGRAEIFRVSAVVLLTYAAFGVAFSNGWLSTTTTNLTDYTRPLVWLRLGVTQTALALLTSLAVRAHVSRTERAHAARIGADVARREAERALVQSQKLEVVGRLATGVAHDFNNLLSIVGGWSTALEKDATEQERREALEAIEAAVARAGELTRQLLNFARKDKPRPTLIDLVARCRDTAAALARILPRTIRVTVEADDDLPQVLADAGQVDQMLLNLAINARDAMPDGGALILRVMRVSERVVVQVKDTGVGMSEDVRARIFDPFFTTKQPGQGTGLGLATVFSIVAAHGGTIEAESEEGRGSTFSIALPVAQSVGSFRPGA